MLDTRVCQQLPNCVYRHFTKILCLLVFPLVGCATAPKSNAPLTRIEERRPITGDYHGAGKIAASSTPQFLNFQELARLYRNPDPEGALGKKLAQLWRTPIISNQAWESGIAPKRASNQHLGEFLRLGTWNIEKSLHLHEVASSLTSERDYVARMRPGRIHHMPGRRMEMLRQRERLAEADILLFQEMDIGVDRSDYHHSPELLAAKLEMNFAYAPMQIELEPIIQSLESPDSESPDLIDPDRYRGLFGLLVLSKYPIRSATAFPLENHAYDWHEGELTEYDVVEVIRRTGSNKIFDTRIEREVKVGGRVFFRVDLAVPGLPDDTLSVIHVHLEIRAKADDRREQMREILSHIEDIRHPVILAGDFNSSRYDLSPTSLPRVVSRGARNPNVWIFGGMNLLLPAHAIYNTGRTVLNEFKNLHNPLAFHNPVIAPNETAGMFEDIRQFRFSDGGKFDFRGNHDRSINQTNALLGNSNEKALKGYRPTFAVNRPIGPFGRHRLDWIFVKSTHLTDHSDSFRLAPHFGETLIAFDHALEYRLSDHRPSVVDLPLDEPVLPESVTKGKSRTSIGGPKNRTRR